LSEKRGGITVLGIGTYLRGEKQMQLLQKLDLGGVVCWWLFGLEDFDAIPLILNISCFVQGLASDDDNDD
jgi:hypothetical protein